jgi:hypothetical protein
MKPNEERYFVRDFYESFYDEYIAKYSKDAKLIICGTVGIFTFYCLIKYLK